MAEKVVYIKFFGEVNQNTIKALMDTIQQKLKEGANKFVLLISSVGGNVFAGITGYNFLKGVPAKIETFNIGSTISVAVALYCAGSKRYSAPHATFLIHGVTWGFAQPITLEEKQLEECLKACIIDKENIAGVIAATTGKKEAQVLEDMHNRTTLNPEEAIKYGLVHEIKESLFETGAELISIQ